MTGLFSRTTLRNMDTSLLRAVLRERAHHSFEYQLYRAIFAGAKLAAGLGGKVREILDIAYERGLSPDLPDVHWARQLLDIAGRVRGGERVAIPRNRPQPLDEAGMTVVDHVIFGRRSIRQWQNNPVPDSLIRRVVEAGLWAPHACNLQTLRVVVLNGPARHLLSMGETRGAALYLVVCQDRRAYEFYAETVPDHNRGLDCGAAVQNMLLMAHALGLGAVWGTFDDRVADRIRMHFGLRDYVDIVTYVALGWPAEDHIPPGRMNVEEVLLASE